MKKFLIEDTEKSRILEMHKSLMNEQSNSTNMPIKDQLQAFIDQGCFPSGTPKVVPMKSTNPQKSVAIKLESTKTPGKFRYFFIDNTVGQKENETFTILTSKWSCDTNKLQKDKDKNTATLSASTENINKIKKEGNWNTKEELVASGDTEQNIANPIMYDKMTVGDVTLYRRKASSGISSSLTSDQKSIIDDWKSKGYKLRNELTPEESKTFKSQVVSPASEGYFSQDLVMYFNPSAVQGLGQEGEEKVSITTVVQNAVNSRIPTDKKDCKQTIEAYYISWKKKRPLAPNEFNALKTKAQACKNEFYGDWGATLGGNKTDKIVDILTGVSMGGPTANDKDSVWRLM